MTGRLSRLCERLADFGSDSRAIMNEVRLVGAGLIFTLIIVLVLTEVFDAIEPETDTDGDYVGTFGEIFSTVEGTGVAALTLIVVGFLVVAATAIMRFFGNGFGGR